MLRQFLSDYWGDDVNWSDISSLIGEGPLVTECDLFCHFFPLIVSALLTLVVTCSLDILLEGYPFSTLAWEDT